MIIQSVTRIEFTNGRARLASAYYVLNQIERGSTISLAIEVYAKSEGKTTHVVDLLVFDLETTTPEELEPILTRVLSNKTADQQVHASISATKGYSTRQFSVPIEVLDS